MGFKRNRRALEQKVRIRGGRRNENHNVGTNKKKGKHKHGSLRGMTHGRWAGPRRCALVMGEGDLIRSSEGFDDAFKKGRLEGTRQS